MRILRTIFIPVIALVLFVTPFFAGFTFVNKAIAACTAQLNLEHYPGGSGPPTIYSSNSEVVAKSGDTYSLNYKILGCIGEYEVSVTYNGNKTVISSGSTGNDLDEDRALQSPVIGGTYTYNVSMNPLGNPGARTTLKELAITFVNSNTKPLPPTGNYTPTDVTVCNLGSTTARICWKTQSPSNSEIVYGKDTETLDSDNNKPNFRSGTTFNNTDNHFLNLSGLTANTKYKYIVRSSPNANTTSTKSAEYTFTTKKADGTGGDTGGQGNTNAPNTNVDVKVGDLDANLGTIFNPLTPRTVPQVITSLIRILFVLIGIASVIVIIISGFRMVLASGNEAQLTAAKKAITWAIIGLVISLLSFSIVAIVQRLIEVGAR